MKLQHRKLFVILVLIVSMHVFGACCLSQAQTKNKNVFYEKGVKLFEEKKYSEAIDAFKKVLIREPANEQCHYYLGICYQEIGMKNHAIEEFNDVIKINPTNTAAHKKLAQIYLEQNKFELAEQEYINVTALNDKDEEAYFALGDLYYKQQELSKAVQYYKNGLSLNPRNAGAFYNLGNIYYSLSYKDDANRKKWADAAIAAFRNVVKYEKGKIDAYIWLGALLRTKGQFGEANQIFQQALSLVTSNKDRAELHYQIAMTYYTVEDTQLAKEECAKALKINSDHLDAIDLKKMIEDQEAMKKASP